MAIPFGFLPTAIVEIDATAPLRLIRNSERLPLSVFVTATSPTPSPFTSPIAKRLGILPVANGEPAIVLNPPLPSPSRRVKPSLPRRSAVLLGELTIARSGLPSSLTSPTATKKGESPQGKGEPAEGLNPPLPSPSRTVTLS